MEAISWSINCPHCMTKIVKPVVIALSLWTTRLTRRAPGKGRLLLSTLLFLGACNPAANVMIAVVVIHFRFLLDIVSQRSENPIRALPRLSAALPPYPPPPQLPQVALEILLMLMLSKTHFHCDDRASAAFSSLLRLR